MKYKILKVIETCSDCEFAKEYRQADGSTEFALICHGEFFKNGETHVVDSFLIDTASEPIKSRFTVKIPPNCPLETYNHEPSNQT